MVQSYVDAYDLSYPEALQQIENEVEEIYQALGEEGVFELNDLGSLSRNSDGNLAFEPFESGILTPLYYGLSSYEFPKLISNNQSATSIADIKPQKQGVVFVDDTDATNKRLSISMRAVRNVALQRSSLQLSFLVAFPGSNRNGIADKQQIKSGVLYNIFDSERHLQQLISKLDALTSNSHPMGIKRQQEATIVASHYWSIVMASHITESNARAFVAKLKKNGLTDARVYDGPESIKVLYGYFQVLKRLLKE